MRPWMSLLLLLVACEAAPPIDLDDPQRAHVVASVGSGIEGDGTASVYRIGDGAGECTPQAWLGAATGNEVEQMTMIVKWDGTSPAVVDLAGAGVETGAPPMAWVSGTDSWALIGGTAEVTVDEVAGTAEIDFSGGQACPTADYDVMPESDADCTPLDATVSVTWAYGYYEATNVDATAADDSGYCYEPR